LVLEERVCAHDRGVAIGERSDESGVNLLARDVDARVFEVRGRACVTDNRDSEAQIHGRPHRRIYAHRGHHSGHDQLIDPLAPQATFEIGAQECIRRLFDYNRLILGRSHSIIVLEPGGAGLQVLRVRFIPRVLDVPDRLGSRPEGAEHTRGDVSRVIAPDQGMSAAREVVALDIDQKQCAGHNATLPPPAPRPEHVAVPAGAVRVRVAVGWREDRGFDRRPEEDAMESVGLLDRAGRRRSPATLSGFHQGRVPRNKGLR
jgi:hypothetical protein